MNAPQWAGSLVELGSRRGIRAVPDGGEGTAQLPAAAHDPRSAAAGMPATVHSVWRFRNDAARYRTAAEKIRAEAKLQLLRAEDLEKTARDYDRAADGMQASIAGQQCPRCNQVTAPDALGSPVHLATGRVSCGEGQ